MNKEKTKFIIGLLISAVFLYFSFKNVDFNELWKTLKGINYWWLIPFFALTIFSFYIRALRWRYLLSANGNFSTWRLFSPLMVGFMMNSLLPLRLGEFARAYMMGKKEKFSTATSFATIVLERVFDGIALIVCFMIVLVFLPDISGSTSLSLGKYTVSFKDLQMASRGLLFAVILLLIFIILLAIERTNTMMVNLIKRFSFLPHKVTDVLIKIFHMFSKGFHSLRDFKTVLWILFYSFFVWLIIGFSLQVMAWGFRDVPMSFFQGIAVMIIICFAITLPSAPGYWGLYELGCIFALYILGIQTDRSVALGYSLIIHSMQMLPVILIGFYFLWAEGISIKELSSEAEEVEEEVEEKIEEPEK